jgi:hypothetical protein
MAKKKNRKILPLVMTLIIVVLGSILFVGAASGWFDNHKVKLDAEYYADGAEFMELTAGEYEGLIEAKKSFVVMVDQSGCTTADRLREYVTRYMTETGILFYQMMFEEMKETTLHEQVKYYPSVAIVSRGRAVAYLKADSDEDADIYNDYEAFKEWMGKYLR